MIKCPIVLYKPLTNLERFRDYLFNWICRVRKDKVLYLKIYLLLDDRITCCRISNKMPQFCLQFIFVVNMNAGF